MTDLHTNSPGLSFRIISNDILLSQLTNFSSIQSIKTTLISFLIPMQQSHDHVDPIWSIS